MKNFLALAFCTVFALGVSANGKDPKKSKEKCHTEGKKECTMKKGEKKSCCTTKMKA